MAQNMVGKLVSAGFACGSFLGPYNIFGKSLLEHMFIIAPNISFTDSALKSYFYQLTSVIISLDIVKNELLELQL